MAVCCQNLPLGALSSRSAFSVLVGGLFKKFSLFFFEHAEIHENAITELRAITESVPGSTPTTEEMLGTVYRQ